MRAPLAIAIGLNRARLDFSDRERLLAEAVRPHLMQAYRNARVVTGLSLELALLRRGIDSMEGGIVILGRDGRVRSLTARGRSYLARYFGDQPRSHDRLPRILDEWVSSQQRDDAGDSFSVLAGHSSSSGKADVLWRSLSRISAKACCC